MDVQIYDTMPEGWRMVDGATTAPKGYAWIYNGQSRFSGQRRHALLIINNQLNKKKL